MTAAELADKALDIAEHYKTLYVMGCFGAPMTPANKTRYCANNAYNRAAARVKMIEAATDDTFGFDCVCLLKAILWGWCGDKTRTYGGAGYAVNGVPDIGADSMIRVCSGVSTDFSGIVKGAAVWLPGHIGVYIGNGLAVECSPKWKNCVQVTAVANIGTKPGYNARRWTKWGRLPYVTYEETPAPSPTPAPDPVAVNYRGEVTAEIGLRCREEPVDGVVLSVYKYGAIVTITKELNGWGYTGAGWVSLEYIRKLEDETPAGEEEISLSMTKAELEEMIRKIAAEVVESKNPVYKDLKDVPAYWRDAAAALLDAGVVNGGTEAAVNATDLNLREETLKAAVIAVLYCDKKTEGNE
ncbi:MAG: hypothetical protein DBX59_01895 [Bacillota bacterium]|nr:MAG: hypothetical protein DBX59_01895 [Bacillota bacterium]